MATTTTNYGWTKPSYEDDADIMVINDTIDDIDAQVKLIETNISTKLNKPTINNGSFAIGTDYTLISDLTVTLPKRTGGVVARISAELYYNASRPAGIILSLSNDSSNFDNSSNTLAKIEITDDVLTLNTNILIENRSQNTRNVYVWLKSKTAANNRAVVVFEDLNL